MSLYDGNYLVSQNNDTIFYELTSVSTCTFPCKICVGSECSACFSSILTSNYLLYNRSCHSSCNDSTYVGDTSCLDCPLSCALCSSNTSCSKCTSFYYLHESSCLTDCPSTYYPSDAQQTCESCVYPCVECVN